MFQMGQHILSWLRFMPSGLVPQEKRNAFLECLELAFFGWCCCCPFFIYFIKREKKRWRCRSLPSLHAWRRVGDWLSLPPSGMSRLGLIAARFSRRREVLVEARRVIFFVTIYNTHILCLSIRIATFSRVEFKEKKKPLGVFLTWIENFQFRCVFSLSTTNKTTKSGLWMLCAWCPLKKIDEKDKPLK